ncbi:CLUMA_CG001952, isoform A [Clunio marinus]|uniref:CLUMA_CG001952, isoform A n=1 Tax=Clunio marinus TaxID=568069 RepID=A0A1J1HJF7_9DIPT|nr:CLUMA_CG001952, isoform A [Clunio marinus]
MLNLQQISKADPILLPTLLNSLQDNRVFKKVEYRESFIKNINTLLTLRESRKSALSILNIFCDHHTIVNSPATEKTCPEISWINHLLKIIEQDQHSHIVCFQVLTKLMRILSGNPDTNKIIQSKYIQKIIESILGCSASPIPALTCLATCFELHGGTSGIYKNKIYDYCVSFIDFPDDGIIEKVGLCLHLLQQSRGGSVGGGVYKKCWAEYHDKTIGSLEELLEEIMKKSSDKNDVGKSGKLQLPELKLSPQPFNRYTQLFIRFQNIMTFLRVSLIKPFTTSKSIKISRILSLIEDGIMMSQGLIGKKAIAESLVLSLIHSRLHLNLLDLLNTLMVVLKQNIITYSKNISDILWRCLKQTSNNEQQKFETNLKLRAATYDAFINFMKISPNNFHFKNVMENIMKEAFIDVTPTNDEICLIVPQQDNKKSNRRKKVNIDKKFLKQKTHMASNEDEQLTCVKALECLRFILISQGAIMKPTLFYIMQEKILAIGFSISSTIQQDGDLYRDPSCRSRLSDLITSMMTHPVQKIPTLINYCIALLTKIKQTDSDAKVRENAERNLYTAETTIHNRKDVFYFPIDYREFRDTLMFNKQIIKKFNEPVVTIEKVNNEESNDVNENIENEEDDEKQESISVAEGNEISEEEVLEESSSEEESPIIEPLSTKTTNPSSEKVTENKRPSTAEDSHTTEKKQKISNGKEEELLEEYLADFTDDM